VIQIRVKGLLIVIFLVLVISGYSQNVAPEFQPYFSAVIVNNLEESVKWYQSVLNLKVKTNMNHPNHSYHIIILESSDYMLELLELRGSLAKDEVMKGKPKGTEVQGHFKIGFKIASVNDWVRHLKSLRIDVPQVWTDSTTGMKNFLVKDPDGNLVQFFEK
jgi:catechol 2,3-dioxygenase-like lactoylglutathione lyase family enzyme